MKKIQSRIIDIDEIASIMEIQDRFEQDYYLDVSTGEIICLPQEVIDVIYGENIQLSDWEKELIPEAEAVLNDEKDRYLRIPEDFSYDKYNHMVAFAHSVKDRQLRRILNKALSGKGGFQHFKDILAEHPDELTRWYKWHDDYERKLVHVWLESEGYELVEEE